MPVLQLALLQTDLQREVQKLVLPQEQEEEERQQQQVQWSYRRTYQRRVQQRELPLLPRN